MMFDPNDDNILNIYQFGSFVYESNDEQSDRDYIIVTEKPVVSDNVSYHYFTRGEFQNLLDGHDIQMLECWSLPIGHINKHSWTPTFHLDKQKLRKSISTISSNSWVKGKKKLIVTGDYDLRAGFKSIYHSLRILDYGIQICQYGEIHHWSRMNWVLDELKKLSLAYSRVELWEKIDNKFRSLYNSKSTAFKALAPKDLKERDRKETIKELFDKYRVQNEDLINEILMIL